MKYRKSVVPVGLLACLLVSMLSGCTHSRLITPWLRSWHQPALVLYAESGGPKGASGLERRTNGHWMPISRSSCALAIPQSQRALYSPDGVQIIVADEKGSARELPCRGQIRLSPDQSSLFCLQFAGWHNQHGKPFLVAVQRFALDGAPLGALRLVTLPAGTHRDSFHIRWIGFVESQPLLSIHTNQARSSHSEEATTTYFLYEVGPSTLQLRQHKVATRNRRYLPLSYWASHLSGAIHAGYPPRDAQGRACHLR